MEKIKKVKKWHHCVICQKEIWDKFYLMPVCPNECAKEFKSKSEKEQDALFATGFICFVIYKDTYPD